MLPRESTSSRRSGYRPTPCTSQTDSVPNRGRLPALLSVACSRSWRWPSGAASPRRSRSWCSAARFEVLHRQPAAAASPGPADRCLVRRAELAPWHRTARRSSVCGLRRPVTAGGVPRQQIRPGENELVGSLIEVLDPDTTTLTPNVSAGASHERATLACAARWYTASG